MSGRRQALLGAFALVGLPVAASDVRAQSPKVAPGARVRVTYWGDLAGESWAKRQSGTVHEIGHDRLILVEGGTKEEFLYANVRGLEISAGHRPRLPRFFLGAGVGLVAGVTIGGLVSSASESSSGGFGAQGARAIGVAFTGGVGAVLGGIIGASTGGEVWQSVDIPSGSLGLGVSPQRSGGVSARVAVRL